MTDKQMFLGVTTTLVVMGAYFVGLFQGQRHPVRWREYFASVFRKVTRRGILWSVAVPTGWVLLFYSFIAHVWWSLGRWPKFGEALGDGLLLSHGVAAQFLLFALLGSLFFVPLILVGSLFLPRWQHVSIYVATYAAAVGVAIGALFLAPDSFMNWFFD
jgi:hypothetical protein